jgi:hypothetical protein
MIPKKPAPDLIRGVYRCSDKIVRKRKAMVSQRAKAGCAAAALPATGQAGTF